MDASRHPLPGLWLGAGHSHPTAFDREYPNRPSKRTLVRLLTYDLPHLVELLWSSTARMRYGRVLDVVGRVALVSGLIIAATFPPWRVTYTFAPHNKEALYRCRDYVGVGPIVGGRDAVNARALWPSGEYRLYSKAPWASFPSRIHCDGYTGKQVGISVGRWLMHFVAILAGYGLWTRGSAWIRGGQRTVPHGSTAWHS